MKFHNRVRKKPEIMIVSLIDIFAILLIFIIVTTTFKKTSTSVTIKLPESKTAVAVESGPEPVILSITAEEDIYLDAKKVSIDELAPSLTALREGKSKFAMAMKADKKVSYGFLIQVLDALKDAGIKGNLSAFTEQKK